VHLHQAISITQGEEGHIFLRDLACKRVALQAIVLRKKVTGGLPTPRPGVQPKLYYVDVEDANVLVWQNANVKPVYPDYAEYEDDKKAKTETVVNFAKTIKNFKEAFVQPST